MPFAEMLATSHFRLKALRLLFPQKPWFCGSPFGTQKLSSSTDGQAQRCFGGEAEQYVLSHPRLGRPRAEFSKQWTPIVLLPEMSKDIRLVRAVTEQGGFLTPCEKASCRISLKSARFQSKTGAFLMILTVLVGCISIK